MKNSQRTVEKILRQNEIAERENCLVCADYNYIKLDCQVNLLYAYTYAYAPYKRKVGKSASRIFYNSFMNW